MAYQIINPEMEAKFLVNLKKQETNILRWGEKKEVFKYVLITGYWHGYPGGGLTRNPTSYDMGLGSVYGFLW